MSISCVATVLSDTTTHGEERLALLGLADVADDDGLIPQRYRHRAIARGLGLADEALSRSSPQIRMLERLLVEELVIDTGEHLVLVLGRSTVELRRRYSSGPENLEGWKVVPPEARRSTP